MGTRPSLALLLVAATACSAQNKANYALAGVAVAAAVGQAAIHRAVTGRCWGDCAYGTRCDEASGLCVPVESYVDPPPPAQPPPPAEPVGADDSCAGYCLEDERCVIVPNGDVECRPRAEPTAPR